MEETKKQLTYGGIPVVIIKRGKYKLTLKYKYLDIVFKAPANSNLLREVDCV